MSKPTVQVATALSLASLKFNTMTDLATGVQDNGYNIPTPVLLKLGEECSELSQAILKCLNSGSGGHHKLSAVLEEAGHVRLFLEIVEAFTDGEITKARNARIERHLSSPKSSRESLTTYVFSHLSQIYEWMEQEEK